MRSPSAMQVRAINVPDKPAWLALRRRLLPALSDQVHERDWTRMMEQRGQRMTLVCIDDEGGALRGMLEVSRQPAMDEREPAPVARVNTLYVEPGEEREVAAERLAEAAARWAQAHGCRSLVSEISLDNQWEQRLHVDLGFEEVARKVVYRRSLSVTPVVETHAAVELHIPRVSEPVTLGADQLPQVDDGEQRSGWWPGPVRAAIIAVGILCFYFTDVFSGNIFYGVVLPIVDLIFVIYLMFLFVGMKYRRRTGSGDRQMELYQASNDGE